ncbi:MAG: AAA family ATPase, partial [Planctomycetota bacterium]
MRLKRLELFGFKSFADRTTFEFGDDTLTGVVGPNGCGKSNVVDAMRWVLGEQRAKSMRGAEMADVIFKGSSSRPGLSVAEVTMTLDNTISEGAEEAGARVIEDRGPEVMITRRVFKSGEGEYLIDGEKVRLKDVREMLFDTGLGSRGYSVLEQGKIDAVLSADPRERRRIFEEAAGISRYRQRKHEMELRTKRVEADCERLDDILGELRSRERSLKIQAGKAERYVTTRTEWMGAKTRLYRFKFGEVLRELNIFGEKLGAAESHAQELRDARSGVDGEVTEREREREAITSELERLSSEAARVSSEGRAVDERKSFLASRVQNLQAQSEEEAERAAKLEQALEERRRELESLRGSHADLTAQAERIRVEMTERSRARRAHETDYGSVRKEAQAASERVLGLLHRRTELKNRLHHLEEAREPLAERAERIRNRADEAREALRAVSEEDARAQAAVVRSEAQVENADAERRGIEGEVQSLEVATKQAVEREQALDLERARIAGRLDSLRDSSAELADLGEGARKVLEACATGEGPCGEDELQGLLADHLRIETRFARSLDAVLGDRARALVVRRGAGAAREIAAWLRREEGGVAGVSSADGLARLMAKTAAVGIAGDPFAEDPRVVARLSDCVQSEANFSDLAHWLCSDVLFAGDLDSALQLV